MNVVQSLLMMFRVLGSWKKRIVDFLERFVYISKMKGRVEVYVQVFSYFLF